MKVEIGLNEVSSQINSTLKDLAEMLERTNSIDVSGYKESILDNKCSVRTALDAISKEMK